MNDKAIVHIYLHPYKSASTCFNYVTLKNNHAPSAKTQPVFKKLHVWTAEAVKHQGQFLAYAHLGHWLNLAYCRARIPRNEFAMVFQEQSKTAILTSQTMQVLCYPLTQGHLDYRFDMVIVGAMLLEAQVHSFRFQKQEFSQILTNMYKQMQRNRSILD